MKGNFIFVEGTLVGIIIYWDLNLPDGCLARRFLILNKISELGDKEPTTQVLSKSLSKT